MGPVKCIPLEACIHNVAWRGLDSAVGDVLSCVVRHTCKTPRVLCLHSCRGSVSAVVLNKQACLSSQTGP